MKDNKPELEVGREYALATFYGFKTGPHHVTYLGDSHFRGCERGFFREIRYSDRDGTEYFAIREPILSGQVHKNVNHESDKRNGLLIIKTKLPDFPEDYFDPSVESENSSDEYEIVFKIGAEGEFLGDFPGDPGPLSLEDERSGLVRILEKLEGELVK